MVWVCQKTMHSSASWPMRSMTCQVVDFKIKIVAFVGTARTYVNFAILRHGWANHGSARQRGATSVSHLLGVILPSVAVCRALLRLTQSAEKTDLRLLGVARPQSKKPGTKASKWSIKATLFVLYGWSGDTISSNKGRQICGGMHTDVPHCLFHVLTQYCLRDITTPNRFVRKLEICP
jgi:hypothetical protein